MKFLLILLRIVNYQMFRQIASFSLNQHVFYQILKAIGESFYRLDLNILVCDVLLLFPFFYWENSHIFCLFKAIFLLFLGVFPISS